MKNNKLIVDDRDPAKTEPLSEINRREALQKIGKFSAYAAPSALAILGSKPAHASVNLFEA